MPEQPQQQIVGRTQITTGSIGRSQLNIDFPTQAVIRKIIAGIGIGLASTGVDSGTGDVTVMVTGTFFTENEIGEIAVGAVGSVIPADGWISDVNWVRTGNHSFVKNGNATDIFEKGTKLKCVDGSGSTKYGVVGSSGFTSGSVTTVNLIPNTDYILSGTITNFPSYSPIQNPGGFPHWFNWDAAPLGFSVVPSSPIYRWQSLGGNSLMLNFDQPNNGTSNDTVFTASAPIAGANITGAAWTVALGTTVNNNVLLTVAGRMFIGANSTIITFRSDAANGAWTAALGKRAIGTLIMEF